ncbi:ExbD/TolR family protein [Litorivicinus lipolyticus]|uniref:ExbD/TolR family protein n=1 Tax=Litorivicinus lipolyticus TaxID=418701 RepID=UPI003B5C38C2
MKFSFDAPTADPGGPNLTPLIDVVFLLLIFFMVSSSFLEASAIEVRLPEAAGKAPDNQPDDLVVYVKADGSYRIGESGPALTGRSQLGAALERARQGQTTLVVAADGRSPHQAVITLLDLSSQIGVNSLRFKAQEPQ